MIRDDNSCHPAVFLDRDGVLVKNIDGDYIRSIDQVSLLPGAVEAVCSLICANITPVIVTNQAVVGKGVISMQQAWYIQNTIEQLLLPGRKFISAICPHIKEAACGCRKPKPGMILDIADRYSFDLEHSFLIGDAMTDIAAARAANIKPILVLSGRGRTEYSRATKAELNNLHVSSSISEAVKYIIKTLNKGNIQ
jgi:histidinol-phosphate phosphatase domain